MRRPRKNSHDWNALEGIKSDFVQHARANLFGSSADSVHAFIFGSPRYFHIVVEWEDDECRYYKTFRGNIDEVDDAYIARIWDREPRFIQEYFFKIGTNDT